MKYYTERLPEKYAIKTNEGRADKYEEAIDIFNEINDTDYNGSYFIYYFNNGSNVDCTDSIYNFDSIIYTPKEFIDLLTKPDSKTDFEKEVSKMRYSEGDILVNDCGDEAIVAAKIGACYILSSINFSFAKMTYTQQELDKDNYELKSKGTETSKIKLTLEDVARMYGTDVSNIEIVQ